jgi:PPP family 3-phenylpropionic acid transporter
MHNGNEAADTGALERCPEKRHAVFRKEARQNKKMERRPEETGAAEALRIGVFYAALFLLIGCYMAFLPIWLKWRGMSDAGISFLFAVPLLVRVVLTPAVTFLADWAGNRRAVVCWLSTLSLTSLAALPFAPSAPLTFICLTVFALGWTSVMPLTETIALTTVRRLGMDYGRLRLWGSLSFIAATSGGGYIVYWGGPQAALWLVEASAALMAAAAPFLPKPEPAAKSSGTPAHTPIRLEAVKLFLHSPAFLLFLAATAAASASHAIYNTLATVHWEKQGFSPQAIGFLWAVGVLAEVLLFAYSKPVLARIPPAVLIAVAAGAAAFRWSVMAFNPPLEILFPLQTLHALTFGAAHLGATQFLSAAVQERYAATGQGLYAAAASGIGMGGAYIIAGPLMQAMGAPAFLVMAGFAGVALVLALPLNWQWKGEVLGDAQADAVPFKPAA